MVIVRVSGVRVMDRLGLGLRGLGVRVRIKIRG